MMVHNPYVRDRAERNPLSWDTACPFISERDLGSDFKMERRLREAGERGPYLGAVTGAYTKETADKRQWSYWPSEPPVLAAKGYKWFDYGPLARGMNLWGQVPVGTVPSAEEQRTQLKKHYTLSFAGGSVPPGLNYWLKQHGLKPITRWGGYVKVGIGAVMFFGGLWWLMWQNIKQSLR